MEELLEILKDLHPEVDFGICDSLIDDKILDSFDIVSIIAEINDRFDITVTAEKITPQNFNSARALYALIQELEDEE
ncbi:D-alanine--poly(phosphoribitol) ligase subunit 2 [Lachnospiraceae bacterium]|nr:phosphopantetheine-binding protein [Acetatifactor sp.]GFH94153.1 D-alanine--poly(phosphoribitol) ligase subunit 2 [Lachnospiraceae bacterium]